jgi:hypothetical protein
MMAEGVRQVPLRGPHIGEGAWVDDNVLTLCSPTPRCLFAGAQHTYECMYVGGSFHTQGQWKRPV